MSILVSIERVDSSGTGKSNLTTGFCLAK